MAAANCSAHRIGQRIEGLRPVERDDARRRPRRRAGYRAAAASAGGRCGPVLHIDRIHPILVHRLFPSAVVATARASRSPQIGAIYDLLQVSNLRVPIRGGVSAGPGAGSRGNSVMIPRRLATTAAFCVLAARQRVGAAGCRAKPCRPPPTAATGRAATAAPASLPQAKPLPNGPRRRSSWRTRAARSCSRAWTWWRCQRRPCARAPSAARPRR